MTQPSVFNSTTPRFSLPLLFAGQAQKEFFVNEAHVLIDVLMHMSVKGLASTPPSAPAEGECWLVDATPVGEWAGHIDSIAFFAAGAWSFLNPVPGMRVFNISNITCSTVSGMLLVRSQFRPAVRPWILRRAKRSKASFQRYSRKGFCQVVEGTKPDIGTFQP